MKKYKLEHSDIYWKATFSVDENHPQFPVLKESINFFYTNWESDLETDDLFTIWAKYYGSDLVDLSKRLNIEGVVDDFGDMEGHIKLDGSYGVTLLSIDNFSMDEYDFEVEEIK